MPAPAKRSEPEPPGCGVALSLTDLGRARPEIRGPLLKGKLRREPVRPDPGRPTDVAVEFSCELTTAVAIVDVLRDHDRAAGDRPCRVWIRPRRGGGWIQLRADAVLCVVVGGRVLPNHELFRPEVRPTDLVAPPFKPAIL